MSIERNYEYSKENKLLYNIDNYDVNDGLSIDFDNGMATLRNINTNPKSDNFFGDGRLGSQTYINDKMLSPTCCYFQSLIINDTLYGTHLQGVFAETSVFNAGDEVILYKKHCASKDLYDEVGKWDIVKIVDVIEDQEGINRYVLDKAPNNDYIGSETVNTATLVMQFDRLTIGATLSLQPDMDAHDTMGVNTYNWRDSVRHPESDIWGNKMLGNPRGIMYIKVRDKTTMLEDSKIFNHVGTFGGYAYQARTGDELDDTVKRHDYHVPPCGFLPSPSDGLSSNDDPLAASELCDYAGYLSSGGSSFNAEGDRHADNLYTAMQIPEEYKGTNGDLDKMFMGMPTSYPMYSSYWGFGSDGGGIIVLQTKELIMEENTIITTPAVRRHAIGYASQPTRTGAGGTTIVKCPNITLNCSKAPIATIAQHAQDTYVNRDEEFIKYYGLSNHGVSIMEFEDITINGVTSTFQEVQDDFDSFKSLIFSDYEFLANMPVGVDDDGNEYEIFTKENLVRDAAYPDINESDTKVNAPTTSMAEYETGKYYKVYTKGLHNVDVGLWSGVNGFEIEADVPEDTEMKVLLSRDQGENWFKINVDDGSASSVDLADIGTSGNTINELLGFSDTIALTGLLVANNDGKTIDVAVGMKTSKQYKTPSIDKFLFNYNGIEVPDAPIRILPYHEEEFDREFVDFVWMEPLQRFGSLQNRLEISPTSNFEPKVDELDIVNGGYSSSEAKLHLPYVSKLVDNRVNSVSDLVLPYLMVKGVLPESTYDESKTSAELNDAQDSIVYHGDTFFVKGEAKQIPSGSVSVPDMATDAPLRSNSGDAGMTIAYKLSDNASEDDFGDVSNNVVWTNNNVAIKPYSYLGNIAYFNGDASMSELVPHDDKKEHPLTKLHQERTIHIKFNPKIMPGRSCLFNFRRDYSSTIMFYIDITADALCVNGTWSYFYAGNYLEQERIALDEEQTVTVVVYDTNRCDVYYNGFKVIEDIVYNNYTTYIDGEDDDESDDLVCDVGICLGRNYEDGNEPFYGSIHEFIMYDHAKTADEVMAISKLPVYHLRHDLRDDTLKLLQYPYTCTELMYDNELWGESFGNNVRQLNHFANHMLANPTNKGFDSNNETLLLGRYSAKLAAKDNFKSVNATKHMIMGYSFYNNDWYGMNNMGQYSLHSNNTIEQNYTSNWHAMIKSGRINKQNTATEIEFIHTDKYRDRTTQAAIGIAYGIHSVSNSNKYYAIIFRRTDLTYYLKVDINVTTYSIELPNFEPGHRYTLSFVPVDGSFQDNVLVKLYSKTNDAYIDNKILFSSAESYGYNDNNVGFITSNYSDVAVDTKSGDWVDVSTIITSIDREFALIGMTCLDSESVVTRDNGYVDSYFIEKRLPAGLTYNIIRMDIISEIRSAMTSVKSIISFDGGEEWKSYDSENATWAVLADTEINTIKDDGMSDADLYAVTDSVAVTGGFGDTTDTILRTYLITDDNAVTPNIISHKVLKNGPRIIDSWKEPGSYYHSEYEWHYLNDGTWNPYMPIDTTDDSSQNWEEFGTGIPNPTEFVEGNGARPSTNLLKTYAHVKVDCLPKGKWYWRVSAYNGLKR